MAGKLKALEVGHKKPGTHGDGGGLYLVVSPKGARKWVFRFKIKGKQSLMGLGSAKLVTLAEARDKAIDARRMVVAGINPIAARRQAELAAKAKPTFGAVAEELVASKAGGWRNVKHRDQWVSSLETYAAIAKKKRELESSLAALLTAATGCELARQLQAKIARARDQLLTFCHYPGEVEATNNGSERKLRPCVIQRKVTNGYRAMWAAQAEADVRTTIDTARLKGANPFNVIVATLA